MKRLAWLDISKGLAILTVVYFHFFRTYFEHGSLPPTDWSTFFSTVRSALRSALRANRWSHRAQSAWPALCRYRHELFLPECRLVVFLHAHSVLPVFSAALRRGEKARAITLSAGRVRARLFRSLF